MCSMDAVTLADMLAPLTEREFFDRVYQKNFLHIPGTPEKFRRLFSWEALNEIVVQFHADPPILHVRKEEKYLALEDFTRSWVSDWGEKVTQIEVKKLYDYLRDVATLSFHEFYNLHRPLQLFLNHLARIFGGLCDTILFASFGGVRALYCHEDGDDNIVLQIAGRKHWKLFGVSDTYPLRKPITHGAKQPPATPVWEKTLEAGDVLYFPRGWWHEVHPVKEPSLHLTIGVPVHSGIDLVHWSLKRLAEKEIFRQDLPLRQGPEARRRHLIQLAAAWAEIFQPGIIDDYLRDQVATHIPALTQLSLPWGAMADHALPADDAAPVRFVGIGWARENRTSAPAAFTFRALNREWTVDARAEAFLRPLLDGELWPLGRIYAQTAATLGRAEVQKIISELVKDGLLAFG